MARLNLREKKLRPQGRIDELDPMASLANLADVMLVFACGLLLALVQFWQIDISVAQEVIPDNKVTQIEDPEDITDKLKSTDGSAYLDLGRVYMDPATGKYYMVLGEDEAAVVDQQRENAHADTSAAAVDQSIQAASAAANATTPNGSSSTGDDVYDTGGQ